MSKHNEAMPTVLKANYDFKFLYSAYMYQVLSYVFSTLHALILLASH